MTDKKKVVQDLNIAKYVLISPQMLNPEMCVLTGRAINSAIALPDIVRCRDCIRRGTYNCPIYVGGDADHGSPDDWFCADGERKHEDD